jgi:CshA-type fibril repeat protein
MKLLSLVRVGSVSALLATALVAPAATSQAALPTPPTNVYGNNIAFTKSVVSTVGQSSLTAPAGTLGVMVKLWGAAGRAESAIGNLPSAAGSGGYTTAVVDAAPASTFQLLVGQSDPVRQTSDLTPTGDQFGFGGQSVHDGGGGLTGLFTGTTAVVATDQARAVAVAGGGGGADGTSGGSYSGGANGNSSTSGNTLGNPGTLAYASTPLRDNTTMQGSVDRTNTPSGSGFTPFFPQNWQSAGGGGYVGGGRCVTGLTNGTLNEANLDQQSGCGGSGFVTSTGVQSQSIEGTPDQVETSPGVYPATTLPPQQIDPDYISGVGVGKKNGAGGNGLAVIYWLRIAAANYTEAVDQGVDQDLDVLENSGYPTNYTLEIVPSAGATATAATVVGNQVRVNPLSSAGGTTQTVQYKICAVSPSTTCSTGTITYNVADLPDAQPLTSTGAGTAVQTAGPSISVPTGGSLNLLDGTTAVSTLTVAGGVYNVVGSTLTFTPNVGYTGTPPLANYRISDALSNVSESTYQPTVTTPAPPAAPDKTSSGVGTAPQTTTITVPPDTTISLVGGSDATNVTIAGEGSYVLDPLTGVITFNPELGFLGTSTLTYQIADAYSQVSTGTYAATVTTPPAPTPVDDTSMGYGAANQTITVPLSPGEVVVLVGGSSPTSLTVPGKGTYTLDQATAIITFTPVPGVLGVIAPATFSVTDAYGGVGTATYTPTVLDPTEPPPAVPHTQSGKGTVTFEIPLPPGATVTLLDGATPVTSITIAGQGTYSIDSVTGIVSFVPLPDFAGTATSVTYEVTDAYGLSARSTFTAVITEAASTVPSAPRITWLRAKPGNSLKVQFVAGKGGTPATKYSYRTATARSSAKPASSWSKWTTTRKVGKSFTTALPKRSAKWIQVRAANRFGNSKKVSTVWRVKSSSLLRSLTTGSAPQVRGDITSRCAPVVITAIRYAANGATTSHYVKRKNDCARWRAPQSAGWSRLAKGSTKVAGPVIARDTSVVNTALASVTTTRWWMYRSDAH